MRKPSSLKTMLSARLMVVTLGLSSFSGPTLADEITDACAAVGTCGRPLLSRSLSCAQGGQSF